MRNLGPPKHQQGQDRELDSACEFLCQEVLGTFRTFYQLILTSTLPGSFILPVLQGADRKAVS